MKMQSKVALVTGAALGSRESRPAIGGPIARKLASEGAHAALFLARDDSPFVNGECPVGGGDRAVCEMPPA